MLPINDLQNKIQSVFYTMVIVRR